MKAVFSVLILSGVLVSSFAQAKVDCAATTRAMNAGVFGNCGASVASHPPTVALRVTTQCDGGTVVIDMSPSGNCTANLIGNP